MHAQILDLSVMVFGRPSRIKVILTSNLLFLDETVRVRGQLIVERYLLIQQVGTI